MTSRPGYRRGIPTLWLAAPLALLSCSSDVTIPEQELLETTTGSAFAIATHVFTPDFGEATTYVLVAEDIDSGQLNLEQGLEIPGRSYLWAPDATGTFYVTSQEQLEITKYALVDGQIEVVGRLGVASAGVTVLNGESMIFSDPTRAWLFDMSSAQALEIDLEEFALARTVDISALLDPDPERFPTTFMNTFPLRRRGPWVVGETFGFNQESDSFSTTSRIVFFDPATGALVVSDSPCGGLSHTAEAPGGDLYFSTSPLLGAVHALDPERAPAPCLVRLPAGAMTPNPATTALLPLTDGQPTGGLIPGSDDTVYLRVLDTEAAPLSPEATGLGLYGEPAWQTWRTRLTEPTSAERVEREPTIGGIVFFELEGTVYENESSGDYSTTTLIRTTGSDAPSPALVLPGVPFSIVRIR